VSTVHNPSQLASPAFLLNVPFSFSTEAANNIWMEEIESGKREPDANRAMVQFLQLYRHMAAQAVVYLLPTPPGRPLQDLVFTANLGIVFGHLPAQNTVVLSNFTSEPRRGETEVGLAFFEQLGYDTQVPPMKFEGEAELKHLHDNVYVGGYGIRSERGAYEWMEREFDATIIKVHMKDPYLYHLDCSLFPITKEQTLVCTELYEREELRQIEEHTEIIDVSLPVAYAGICNSVRLHNGILNSSHIHELKIGTDDYDNEVAKNRTLEDIAAKLAMEVNYFNLSEYHKGGALLSCMVMHLNRYSYSFRLL
jgi:N-dimethylarginine dimethylaminohydrolase